jgi:hypothetical protein
MEGLKKGETRLDKTREPVFTVVNLADKPQPMIPFKPSSEKTLAHQLLTFVKLTAVLKDEQARLQSLKDNRPRTKAEVIKWDDLQAALQHETEITKTEQRISKLHLKTEEYEKELIQYIPDYLYNKTIEINLLNEENQKRYRFLLKVMSKREVLVRIVS